MTRSFPQRAIVTVALLVLVLGSMPALDRNGAQAAGPSIRLNRSSATWGDLIRVQGAGFHGLHRHRNVSMTGDEDDWNLEARIGQVALKVQAADSWQAHV